MTTTPRTCSVCKQEIAVPHCASATCTWCKACVDARREAGERQ